MEKVFISDEDLAAEMGRTLSDNLYYADNFSMAAFTAFCKNLPKPVLASVQLSHFNFVTYRFVTLTFSDFSNICIVVDSSNRLQSHMFDWLTNLQFSDWHLKLDHFYSYRFFKS